MKKHLVFTIMILLVGSASFSKVITRPGGSMQLYPVTPNQGIVISANGNVGIGTTAPSTKLDVAGTVSASALVVNGTVTANSFVGSGTGLTGLAVYVTTTNADARYVSWNGTVGNVSINGTISANTLVAGSGLVVNGSMATVVRTKTTSYSLTGFDSVILTDATGGAFSVTLPLASTGVGRVYTIKKIDASTYPVTVAVSGSDTLDGGTSRILYAQWQYMVVASDGSAWYGVGGN